eukprot:9475712-Pyramimonas_sp.AAC.1
MRTTLNIPLTYAHHSPDSKIVLFESRIDCSVRGPHSPPAQSDQECVEVTRADVTANDVTVRWRTLA